MKRAILIYGGVIVGAITSMIVAIIYTLGYESDDGRWRE